jgi:GntR family transcriptional regulator, phosphonate transport system regulatory protein
MTEQPIKLDRHSSHPLWQQIRDSLITEIRSGQLSGGDKLPPANKLAQDFGVNRHTVRQALMALEEAGLTETRQGAGSFIVGRRVNYPISNQTRFSEILLEQGMEPSGEVNRIREIPVTKAIAAALKVSKTEKVLEVERICRADGDIIGVARHLFPLSRLKNFKDKIRKTGKVSDALKEIGIDTYYRQSTTISARMPTPRECDLLEQPASRPVLVSDAINVDDKGRTIEFGITIFIADRVRIKMDNADFNQAHELER